jgi:hypothetical protein
VGGRCRSVGGRTHVLRKALAGTLTLLADFKVSGPAVKEAEAALAALSTPAEERRLTDAEGIAWFERTFGVPLGDKPGLIDVERVRAGLAPPCTHPACPLKAGQCTTAGGRTEPFDDCPSIDADRVHADVSSRYPNILADLHKAELVEESEENLRQLCVRWEKQASEDLARAQAAERERDEARADFQRRDLDALDQMLARAAAEAQVEALTKALEEIDGLDFGVVGQIARAALASSAEESEAPWRRYDGKGRPVPNGTPIEIKQRDGKVRRDTHFSDATWAVGGRFASEDVEFWRPASPEERSGKAGALEGLADYLHDQALLADSEAAQRVGGQRNRLLQEAKDCRAWAAALASSAPARAVYPVPAGWRLVPDAPSEAMIEAYCRKLHDLGFTAWPHLSGVWPDILAAAPPPKAEAE